MLAVIFDVDGTLADVCGVRHYVTDDPKRKNFEKFHAGASFCPPHRWVVDEAQAFADAGIAVFVVTARREKWRYRTSTWLRKWGVPVTALLMRADHDDRKDFEVKTDILSTLRNAGCYVIHAFDDNPNVIALWESENIPVTVVPGWIP